MNWQYANAEAMTLRILSSLYIFAVLLLAGTAAYAQPLKNFESYLEQLPASSDAPSETYILAHANEHYDNGADVVAITHRLDAYQAQLERSVAAWGNRMTHTNSSTTTSSSLSSLQNTAIRTEPVAEVQSIPEHRTNPIDSAVSLLALIQQVKTSADAEFAASQSVHYNTVQQAYRAWQQEQRSAPCNGNTDCMQQQKSNRDRAVAQATLAKVRADKATLDAELARIKPLVALFDASLAKAISSISSKEEALKVSGIVQSMKGTLTEAGERLKLMRIEISNAAKLLLASK